MTLNHCRLNTLQFGASPLVSSWNNVLQGRTKVHFWHPILCFWNADVMEWWSSELGKSAIWMKMTLIYLIVANMSPNIPNTMPQKSSFSLFNFPTYNSCHPFAPAGSPCPLSFWHSYSLLSTQHITINACIMKSLLNIIGTVSKWLAAFTLFQSLLPSS